MAYRFVKFLQKEGFLEEVVCSSVEIENRDSFKLVRLPRVRGNRFLKTYLFNKFVQRYLREREGDGVINFAFSKVENCHVYRNGGGTHLGFLITSIKGYSGISKVRKVVSRLFNPINYYNPYLEKRIFLSSRRIIAISTKVKQEILRYYKNCPEEKISVIPNSVDLEKFKPIERRKDKNRFVLGFASSNFQLKGLPHLIKALSYLPVHVELLVAGGRNSRKYKKLAGKLGVADRVFFLGKVSNMVDFYSQIDCLVHPSFYDTFANVVSEALAVHRPVIVSLETGAKDLVVEGKNGFILKAVTPEEIASKVKLAMKTEFDFSVNRLLSDEEVFSRYLAEAELSLCR